jgi:tetratricopeptide (TPR) repeat protein
MNIFSRLFGSKKNNDKPDVNQQKQYEKPESGKPENKISQNPDSSQNNPPVKPEPEIKNENKETSAKVTESNPEVQQSGIPWRTFSIFISSTFADMQAERDHLKNVVFPLVEEELQKRRIKLEIVDLRWGVDTTSMAQEDEREASVLKVCLDEIRRCRPFFIGLLGDRYGWVPPLERMKTALAGETHINPEKGKSVTDLEIEFGVLASQEQLVRSVFYFREPLPYETFSKKKAVMFSDEYNDELSETERKERKTTLEKLKTNIRTHFAKKKLENKVKTYSAAWNAEKEKVTGLETWGNTVYTDILAECETHAKDTWDKVPQNWQEQEVALLDAFIENNTATFCGRKPLLEILKKHLLSGDSANWGVVLTGESGSGKSAVFSMMNKMMQQEDCFILAHSAGISPRAKKVADLLQIWNKQLADYLGIKEELEDITKNSDDLTSRLAGEQGKEPTTPIEKLQEKFRELLQEATVKKRVVLLIDALDRFEPTARAQHLSWLPSLMPQNVRLLCTAITGTEKKAVQYHKGLTAKSIDSFTSAEAKEMLDALCLRQHKKLSPSIQIIILEKKRTDGQFATSSPLWLSLVVNMLMAIDYDDFEKMKQLEGRGDQQIDSYMISMANSFDPLPGPLFLSLKNKASILFGETFTTAIFNYIAISRNGLREKDLEKLLPVANIAWDPLRFANLRRWFKAHLILQGDELQWNFAHSIIRNSLIENFIPEKCSTLHFAIATHLLSLTVADSLHISETMFHLLESEKLEEAAKYYGGFLTENETKGATVVLTEAIARSEKGLKQAAKLPQLLVNKVDLLHGIFRKYTYELNHELKIEGNLVQRQTLLTDLFESLQEINELKKGNTAFGYDYEALSVYLGDIYQSIGHVDKAIKLFELSNKLGKELYEGNPRSESLKCGFAVSNIKLGDINQSMGNMEEALKYFELYNKLIKELNEANPSNESFKNGLNISYSRLGSIHQSMGHMEKALKYFENDLKLTKELYEASSRNEELKHNFAISSGKLGSMHQAMGHMEEALNYFVLYNKLGKELYEDNPRNESIKNSLTFSYSRLGDIHQSMGHMEEALKYFELYSKLGKELYEANPRSEDLKYNFAISYPRLGDIHQLMGHMEEALKYFELYSILGKELCEANPRRESLKNSLAYSYSRLGGIHESIGHMEEALKYFELYSKLGKELYEANPRNEDLKSRLANSYLLLGGIHQLMGHIEEAIKYFENYNQICKELYEANPRSESLKNGLAISYSELGSIHQSMGHMEEALKYFENYNQFSKELYEANPRSESLKNGLAISYERLGFIHQSMGHMEEALKYFEFRYQYSKELHKANPRSEFLKQNFAISYNKLGSIHQSMGHMEEALKYFENYNQFSKELYEANPRNIDLLEGLGISYYKLAMFYKTTGNDGKGKERFAEWKRIIAFLTANLPQVQKYRDLDKVEY